MLILFLAARDRAVFKHGQSKRILEAPHCIKNGWLLCVATSSFGFAFPLHHL